MMQFPIIKLKSMQSRFDKLLGLQAAQRAMRARPNYTIHEKWLNCQGCLWCSSLSQGWKVKVEISVNKLTKWSAYDAVPCHKAEKLK